MYFYFSKNLKVTMCILQEALSWKKGISTAPLRSSMYLLHKHPQKKTKNGAKHILMTFLELNQNGGTCWQDSLETLFAAGQQGLEPNTFTGWVCDVPLLFNRFYPFPSFSRMITPEVYRRFGRFRWNSQYFLKSSTQSFQAKCANHRYFFLEPWCKWKSVWTCMNEPCINAFTTIMTCGAHFMHHVHVYCTSYVLHVYM